MKTSLKFIFASWFVIQLAMARPMPGIAAENAARPNFLFIITDDQRWDALGIVQQEQGNTARWPWFKTPNLDRLASQGVRFRNAFVALSLCSPSRATFLTGRYNHHNGVPDNFTTFPTNSVTYASLLREAGYATAYIGKWHMLDQRGQRPGFDFSASFVGQGQYWDCPFEINGRSVPTCGWLDDVTADFSIQSLQHFAQHPEKPFAMIVGFKSPHEPWQPPARARNRFMGEMLKPAPNESKLAAGLKDSEFDRNEPRNLDYFRVISAVDDNLGRILDALDELGLTENTVVVFTSDNGFFRGEHGLHDKRYLYEESLRIPFILCYPPLVTAGGVRDEMMLNLDVCPTFLELAGVKIPDAVEGRSLVPLLAGKLPSDWRQSFLAEYFFESYYPNVPQQFGVRTATSKLVKYTGHPEWTEVFDLQADPYETMNLAADPAHSDLRRRLETELESLQRQTGFKIPPSGPTAKSPVKSAQQSAND